MSEIDPRDFGRLEAKVESLEALVEAQSAKIDSLLELANQTRGGWRTLMLVGGVAGVAGAAITKMAHWVQLLPK